MLDKVAKYQWWSNLWTDITVHKCSIYNALLSIERMKLQGFIYESDVFEWTSIIKEFEKMNDPMLFEPRAGYSILNHADQSDTFERSDAIISYLNNLYNKRTEQLQDPTGENERGLIVTVTFNDRAKKILETDHLFEGEEAQNLHNELWEVMDMLATEHDLTFCINPKTRVMGFFALDDPDIFVTEEECNI